MLVESAGCMPRSEDVPQVPRMHIAEPWYSCILSGTKLVEGRRGKASKFAAHLASPHFVIFNEERGEFKVALKCIRHYDTLYDYLEKEGWSKGMPGLPSERHVIDAYHVFYDDESIAEEGGMCALELQVF
jgi:ASC-1-like (ASCH) protein